MKKATIALPKFAGFYEEEFTSEAAESIGINTDDIDYPSTYAKAARMIVRDYYDGALPHAKSVRFIEVDSPRYYNYRTDDIIAEIDFDETEVLDALNAERDLLDDYLRENYTSRSGFVSFVPNNAADFLAEWADWLEVVFEFFAREWDMIIPEACDGILEAVVLKS